MKQDFRIIPVIDIMNGIAVHARKGIRNKYEPLKTHLINSTSVKDLINAYHDNFPFSEIYIADLDSIIRESPNVALLQEILKTVPVEIMLDAGIRNLYDVLQFKKIGIHKIILATETIDSINVIDDAIKEIGADRITVSIDMKNKNLMARNAEIRELSILDLIQKIYDKGIREIILLELVKIGSKTGCYDDSYSEIRKRFPDLKILIGGGAKDLSDLKFLKKKSMNGVLLATALHEGIINKKDIMVFYQ